MAMKKAQVAVCCNVTGVCENNQRHAAVLVCSHCGDCGDCFFHNDCMTAAGGLVDPVAAVCANDDCENNGSQLKVLVCKSCGRCGDCGTHEHI